jgi:hypothetical protein
LEEISELETNPKNSTAISALEELRSLVDLQIIKCLREVFILQSRYMNHS